MCNLSEGVWEKGREEGYLSSIRNIMSGLNMTAEQAMELLKIPDEEREKYQELLKEVACH